MKSRVFHCVQYEFNPKDGADLHFNEENIKNCLSHKTIKQFAYVKHDKDTYTKEDKNLYGHKVGDLKNVHYHIILRCDDAIEVDVIAKWLGIPVQQVEVPKGRGAFLDNVRYITHEDEKQQKLGKHLYQDEEVHANFDFRKELTQREENKQKYGRDLDYKKQIFYDVLYNGKKISQVINEDKIIYMDNIKKIQTYRMEYILQCNPPSTRINFYVQGIGRQGKGLLSRAIARSLYPNLEKDDDIFFSIGDGKATFEGYDGQPVIIWNDCRSMELFSILGSRGNIFRVFDTHPQKERQNIKYGSINLINAVNIVNAVQPYTEFLDGLAGEYTSVTGVEHKGEDKAQSYGRFPFIIQLCQNGFSVLINKGFIENSRDYLEYIIYKNVSGNFQDIAIDCNGNFVLQRKIENQTVKPIADKYNEILEKTKVFKSEEELLEKFKDYGKTMDIDDLPF